MRISCKSSDAGYDAMAAGHYKIFLNDEDITKSCYTADEELGKVWCYLLNSDGKYRVEDDRPVTQVLFGVVKIEAIR